MKIKDKRLAGSMLGRAAISQRIILIAEEITKGSYKDALELGARISVMIEVASYEDYWREKSKNGLRLEENLLCDFIGLRVTDGQMITSVKV